MSERPFGANRQYNGFVRCCDGSGEANAVRRGDDREKSVMFQEGFAKELVSVSLRAYSLRHKCHVRLDLLVNAT